MTQITEESLCILLESFRRLEWQQLCQPQRQVPIFQELMLSQDCLNHMQVLGKSCPFTVPAPIYEIPELVQQYET